MWKTIASRCDTMTPQSGIYRWSTVSMTSPIPWRL